MYAYTANNPVMRTDSTGMWFGFDDIFTGPVDEIIILGALACGALWLGAQLVIPGASNALDTVGGWVDSAIQKVDSGISKIKNKAKQAMVTLIAVTALELKRENAGTYAIQFSDGKFYVGKSSHFRMITSAIRESILHGSLPVGFRYQRATSDREAFKTEYMWMVDYGYANIETRVNLYNRIWSPGRKYYYEDYGRLYGEDHF